MRMYYFITFTNKYGKKELISALNINMIYYDENELCYTVLFNDGSEVNLDLSLSDGESLIQRINNLNCL